MKNPPISLPKVSIIIATYNRKAFLKSAVDSVLNQSYQNFELIIVDDGSTDDTDKFLQQNYSDNRIKYLYQHNAGQNAAKNTGLLFAKGDYISILDSDDFWHEDKIKKQVNALEGNPNFGVVYCGTFLVDCENNITGRQKLITHKGWVLPKLLMKNFLYNGSNALYRKECIEKTGVFDEHVQRMTDWDLYLRMALYYKFVGLDDYLVYYRVHPENMSCGFKKYEVAGNTILDRIFSNPALDKKYLRYKNIAYALRQKYMARRYWENSELKKCKTYLNYAFSLSPWLFFNIEAVFLYFSTFLPSEYLQKLRQLNKELKEYSGFYKLSHLISKKETQNKNLKKQAAKRS